jgi:hypothetical protein
VQLKRINYHLAQQQWKQAHAICKELIALQWVSSRMSLDVLIFKSKNLLMQPRHILWVPTYIMMNECEIL